VIPNLVFIVEFISYYVSSWNKILFKNMNLGNIYQEDFLRTSR